jgi:hypothetical protein
LEESIYKDKIFFIAFVTSSGRSSSGHAFVCSTTNKLKSSLTFARRLPLALHQSVSFSESVSPNQ